jgi:hypothetical protein
MPHSEAQAWWVDVQHVRESIERRRAGVADSPAPVDAASERRFVRRAAESLPPLDDLEWTPASSGRSGARFDHTGRPLRADRPAPRSRRGADQRAGDSGADRHDPELDRFDFDSQRAALEPADTSARGSADARYESASDGDAPAVAPAATAAVPAAPAALSPPPARRTVQITGRTVAAPPLPRLVEVERRRPARRPAERVGPRPDRIALWAVLLGFFLILVAATSSNAAVHSAHAADSAAVALHAPAR